jgi:hypothetical protein
MNPIEKVDDLTYEFDSNLGSMKGSMNKVTIPSLRKGIDALVSDSFDNLSMHRASKPDPL